MVNLYPFDYNSNISLAWTYLNLGKKAEARAHYTKASAAGSYAPTPDFQCRQPRKHGAV